MELSIFQTLKCVEYFCITFKINGFWPITNFSSRSAHLAKCRLELRWKVFLIAKFSLMSSHFSCSEFIWKHFTDILCSRIASFIFCFQSSAAYHASLAHKTNHSFLPNGLFKYFDRYALSTQRLFPWRFILLTVPSGQFVVFDHPKFGLIPCISTIADIEEGEEVKNKLYGK